MFLDKYGIQYNFFGVNRIADACAMAVFRNQIQDEKIQSGLIRTLHQ